ncbi:Hypothetical predicted protein [Octopus vulgaris]|uniref:Uncharacterized protein n=1 Tax=Octopus vulgaris TaxID=6645 RepID=A0AA36BGI5_OCTVU|nr:Hypothetical predicted protein [Octopus vulgaris]
MVTSYSDLTERNFHFASVITYNYKNYFHSQEKRKAAREISKILTLNVCHSKGNQIINFLKPRCGRLKGKGVRINCGNEKRIALLSAAGNVE